MEQNKIQIYQTADGQVQIEVALEQDTVWLSQEQMALLFDVQKAAVSKHLKNIYASGELERQSTVSTMETVQKVNRVKINQGVHAGAPLHQLLQGM